MIGASKARGIVVDGGIAVAGDIDHRFAVHGHGKGAAERNIVERFIEAGVFGGHVEREIDRRTRGEPVAVMVGVEPDIGALDIGQERAEPVKLAIGGRGQNLIVVGKLRQTQAIDVQAFGIPVFGVAALDVFLRGEPLDLGHGARGDMVGIGVSHRVFDLGPHMFGDRIDLDELVDQPGIDFGELELDGAIVGGRDAFELGPDRAGIERGKVLDEVEGERHVVCRERLAIRPRAG